jgi:hypothetical protein
VFMIERIDRSRSPECAKVGTTFLVGAGGG